ncbi:ABC transporter permease, partial [Fusibacter tunisiensis]|nr:ABC-type dipeptide/oligopeptide/nickel transport system permease subunit [Fusibacter tunisiensis]
MAGKMKETEHKQKAIGPWQIAWERFRKNKVAVVGGGLFIIIVLLVIFVPILSPYDISEFNLEDKELSPSAKHWLGTDEQGRDVLLRLFMGGRISILVGLMAAGVSVTLGSLVGGMAGYYGGKIDNLLMR